MITPERDGYGDGGALRAIYCTQIGSDRPDGHGSGGRQGGNGRGDGGGGHPGAPPPELSPLLAAAPGTSR